MKKFEPHYRLVRVDMAKKKEKASRQQRKWTMINPFKSLFCRITQLFKASLFMLENFPRCDTVFGELNGLRGVACIEFY